MVHLGYAPVIDWSVFLLEEKSSSESKPLDWPWRVLPTAAGIQVNFCRNPACANFGAPPGRPKKKSKSPKNKLMIVPEQGNYTSVSSGKQQPCHLYDLCFEVFPLHSNLGIAEELLRISAYIELDWPVCSNETCEFHGQSGDEVSSRHSRYGANRHGSSRHECASYKKVFAHGGGADKRQRETHRNKDIFCHLVNTVPVRRIVKLLDISTSVLYSRTDFIHRQCQLFAGARERGLLDMPDMGNRYISVDSQKLLVNWASKKTVKT